MFKKKEGARAVEHSLNLLCFQNSWWGHFHLRAPAPYGSSLRLKGNKKGYYYCQKHPLQNGQTCKQQICCWSLCYSCCLWAILDLRDPCVISCRANCVQYLCHIESAIPLRGHMTSILVNTKMWQKEALALQFKGRYVISHPFLLNLASFCFVSLKMKREIKQWLVQGV